MSVAALARRGGDGNLPKTVTGLKLWLDGRRPGSTFADGGAVTTWTNLSGAGTNVTQATASKKPVYRTPTTTGYLTLPGSAGNYASTPDSAAVSVTADIDIRCELALTDWTPTASQALIAKYPATGDLGYLLTVNVTDGKLGFARSSNGTATTTYFSSVGTGVADGTTKWVRVTRVAATGVAQFFLSDDGATWAQLGTDISGASGAIYDSSGALEVGSRNIGTAGYSTGKFYRAQIRDNVLNDGTGIVFDADFTTTGRSFAESSANAAVTINGTGARESVSTTSSILFDGVNDVLSAAFTQAQPFTVYAAYRPDATGADRTWVGGVANNWTGASTTAYEAYGGTALTTGTPTTVPHIVSAVYNSASSVLSVDGTAITGDAGTNGLTSLNIGALNAASQFAKGAFLGALLYSGAHDANTRKKIERWLGRQYGVTVAQ